MLAEKVCSRCGEVKPLSEFYRSKNTKDGRDSRCRTCAREAIDAYQARKRAEDPEGWRERGRQRAARRRQDPAKRARDNMHLRAQTLAISRLKEMYPDAYRHLLDVARREVGL